METVGRKISVVGLGYVGLPVAVAFGHTQEVVAFDINLDRIAMLKKQIDVTKEVSSEELSRVSLFLTADPKDLKKADFHIIAVPTPVTQAKQPDLGAMLSASKLVGAQLKKGDIVVYESTVYPGATEEECVPVLEEASGLACGVDFFVGYSPERINPGDKTHSFTTIRKVVSGQTPEVLDIIADVYASVVTAGVFKASSIKVAEAAKVIENTQRDINIALMNELSIIFKKLGIDTLDVLEAAGTKWNFLPFKPGLVGGHCIGVDPYYLTHKAETVGLHPEVVLSGRRTNDHMGEYVAQQTILQLSKHDRHISHARVGILGFTFKENCPDCRNTRVVDIINSLQEYHVDISVHDPEADEEVARKEYGVILQSWEDMKEMDVLILAVPHRFYCSLPMQELADRLTAPKLMMDIKGCLSREESIAHHIHIWRP